MNQQDFYRCIAQQQAAEQAVHLPPFPRHPPTCQAVSLVEWPERLGLAGPEQQPAEPLEVTISILGQAEQADVQAGLAERQAAAASSSGSSMQAAGLTGDEAADELGSSSSSGDEEEGGGDRRWRRIRLLATGQRWRPRLQLLRRYLAAEGVEVGCYLDD